MSKRKSTKNALEIIQLRFIEGQPERLAELNEARANDSVARKILQLRTEAGLTQTQLGSLIGTTASVISRLENADYDRHSLAMLTRIATALDRRVEVNFVPLSDARVA